MHKRIIVSLTLIFLINAALAVVWHYLLWLLPLTGLCLLIALYDLRQNHHLKMGMNGLVILFQQWKLMKWKRIPG